MRAHRPLAASAVSAALFAGVVNALLAVCGPFTDVSDPAFCPFVQELLTLAITTGVTPTTYDPTASVTRLQMATFLSRTVDRILQRAAPRTILDQLWTTQSESILGLTTVGSGPGLLDCDGTDVWVSNFNSASISRVRGSDGALLGTWLSAGSAVGVLSVMNKVFVTGYMNPGRLYRIDPTLPPGAVTTVASTLGAGPNGIAFDGSRIWTANSLVGGSVSIIPLSTFTVSTVTTGFSGLRGIVFDGVNVWVTDYAAGNLFKLDSNGAILMTTTVGLDPAHPAFDGTNLWVPNRGSNTVTVVRASSAAVLATLTGNGLSVPDQVAFDGQRILVTNETGNSVSLWGASNLTAIGSVETGASTAPIGARSDGQSFWIALRDANKLARF
ncbi:MAG TPA: S-layer homology domain-containing protein [Thermoanaerobaculia bacterium]|nr:S-layer homology domain-containing protein [Thermoanaerobaculia bacterium]